MSELLREPVEREMRTAANDTASACDCIPEDSIGEDGNVPLLCVPCAVEVTVRMLEEQQQTNLNNVLAADLERAEAKKALAEQRENLREVGKHAEAMRVCPNGMCGHCIEILCEEILPRCAPPAEAK